MRYYFLGICGTAMGNAARLLSEMGHEVEGADTNVYPPMSDVLRDAGIRIHEGYSAERLARLRPDCVVVGNAISRGNEEVEWLLTERAIEYCSLPELLGRTVLAGRNPIVVTGTHGKTTTTTLTAYLLEERGAKPGWLIGGVPCDLPGGALLGEGKAFVIEGDEYDSAFFDKRSKFIHYRPQIAILNNLEFDHADIFRDLEDVQRTFRHFVRLLPQNGYALINGDDPNLAEFCEVPWTQVLRVGTAQANDLRITDFTDLPGGSRFRLVWRGVDWGLCEWGMHGEFNARNAAMAILASALAERVDALGGELPGELPAEALRQFKGVRRRQDILFDDENLTVMEDFAHHPTAIRGTLEALRAAFPDRRLVVAFEPRSNTARMKVFEEAFAESLSVADVALVAPVHRGDAMNEAERLSPEIIAERLIAMGVEAAAYSEMRALSAAVRQHARAANVGSAVQLVFFTNGSFDGLPAALVQVLRD